jgi:hypothetical protein
VAPEERTDYMHSCIQCYRVITRLYGASGAYRLYAQLYTVLSCYHKTEWRQWSVQIICTAAYSVIVLSQDCVAPEEHTDYMHSCIRCYHKTEWRQRSVLIICTAAYSVIVLSQDCVAPEERTDYMHSCIRCYHKTEWRQRSVS